jgi:hypothetical protein
MTQEQKERCLKADEHAKQADQAAMAALGPPNSTQHDCSSCGGVATVVFSGPHGREIRFRLGSKGRRYIRLHDDGGGNAAPTSLGREVWCREQGREPDSPKVTLMCGECGAHLICFEGGAK